MIKRTAKAIWRNDETSGQGEISTASGVLRATPYSFATRFRDETNRAQVTNPEELIAAAHAGCYSMALNFQLSNAGIKPREIETEAVVFLDKIGDGFAIRKVELEVKAQVDGIDETRFEEMAQTAKTNCLVSKALAVPIELKAHLNGKRTERPSKKREPKELQT